ncbi:MAG: hypothetical protein ACF8LK_04100 [Phycisphaerales bacterium JB041]
MSDALLDRAADVAFARLEAAGGDPRRLEEPYGTFVTVFSAQGVLDNGGLRYFLGNAWPGEPPYAHFSASYRTLGAAAAADTIDEAVRLLALAAPERDADARLERLGGPVGDRIEALNERIDGDEVWRRLSAFVRAHEVAFSDGAADR